MKSKKLRTIAAALAAIMLVAACPVMGASAAGKCPGVGGWSSYTENLETGEVTWYMKDGSIIVQAGDGSIISSTQPSTPVSSTPAPSVPEAPKPANPAPATDTTGMTAEQKAAVEAGLTLGDWNHEYEQKVFDLVNAEREKLGLPKFVWAKNCTELAQTRAKELSVKFGHVRPDGSGVGTENIASGSPLPVLFGGGPSGTRVGTWNGTPEGVVTSWMNSEGHRENMLGYEVDDAGNVIGATSMAVGCYVAEDGRIWWVQCFSSTDTNFENPTMISPLLEAERAAAAAAVPLTAK